MLDENVLEEYKKMLYDPKIEFEDVMNHMVKYVPDKLYKYSKFENKYFESNLDKGLIYMARPNEFNDPFDSSPHIDVKKYWNNTVRGHLLKQFDLDIDLEKDCSEETLQRVRCEIKKLTHSDMRVSCFTEKSDSLLMWAHYGDSHKGYCIEYDTALMPPDIKRYLLPVIYQNEMYDSTNDIVAENPNCFNFLLHKSSEWSYEDEWRIAIHKNGLKGEMIFKDYISSVIIGMNREHNDWIKVQKWARKHKKPVYQTEGSYDNYTLTKKQILSF